MSSQQVNYGGLQVAPPNAWAMKDCLPKWAPGQDNYGGVAVAPVDVSSAAPAALGPFVQTLPQTISTLQHDVGLDGPQSLPDVLPHHHYGA